MAENELKITLDPAFICARCPNRKKYKGFVYPENDHPVCPRDAVIQEIGKYPTKDQLMAAAERHGMIFSGQVGWNMDTSEQKFFVNIECPNSERGVPGIIMVGIEVIPH